MSSNCIDDSKVPDYPWLQSDTKESDEFYALTLASNQFLIEEDAILALSIIETERQQLYELEKITQNKKFKDIAGDFTLASTLAEEELKRAQIIQDFQVAEQEQQLLDDETIAKLISEK